MVNICHLVGFSLLFRVGAILLRFPPTHRPRNRRSLRKFQRKGHSAYSFKHGRYVLKP